MKTVYAKSNSGTKYTFLADGRVISTDMYIDRHTVQPAVEMNPGDRVTPTAWKYSVDQYQRFLGKLFYVSNPKVMEIGPIYTGNGFIYEMQPWDRAALYNRALSRLNGKARERADWSEDIFDFPETKKLLHPVNTARDMLRDAILSGRDNLPKRKPKLGASGLGASRKAPYAEGGLRSSGMTGLREASKLAASLDLQTSFALRPLVGNIYDTSVSMLNKGASSGVLLRAGAKQPIAVDSRTSNNDIYTTSKSLYHVERGVQGCRIYVRLRAQPAWNPLDLISLNPALWAWNAIPYSFIVDWFFDIGGYLEAMENAFRYNAMFASGYVDHLYANYATEESRGHLTPYNDRFVEFARARRRKIDFEREILHAWPLPRVPRVNANLGSGQLLSAAALLRGLLK